MWELFTQLYLLLSHSAVASLVKAGIVFTSIIVLRLVKVIPNGRWARALNVVFSILLSGATFYSTTTEEVLLIAMTSAASAAVWEVISMAYAYIYDGKQPFELPVVK